MHIKYLQGINIDALPSNLGKEVAKILDQYMELPFDVFVHTKAYNDFSFNTIILDNEYEDEDILEKYLVIYGKGFRYGYSNLEHKLDEVAYIADQEQTKRYRLFSNVYMKEDSYASFPYDEVAGVIHWSEEEAYAFGLEVGYYIRSWDIILNNANAFEELFKEKAVVAQIPMLLPFKGKAAELIELLKAMIANGNLEGYQKDIFKTASSVFGIKLNAPSQTISKLKLRNLGSETKYLDALKEAFLKDQYKKS